MSAFTKILSTSVEDIKDKFPLYLKYLALPFIAMVLYDFFGDYIVINMPSIELAPASDETPAITLKNQGLFSDLVNIIILLYLQLNLAFITHKVTLGKQSEISIIDGLIWRKKHIPFIKAFLVLLLITFLMFIPVIILIIFTSFADSGFLSDASGLTTSLYFLVLALPFIYLFSRYSLIAPAAAANKPIKLADSFSLTKGYGWIIAILTVIIPIILEFLLDALPFTLSIIFINISVIFSIVLLTNCYKYLKQKNVSATLFHENT